MPTHRITIHHNPQPEIINYQQQTTPNQPATHPTTLLLPPTTYNTNITNLTPLKQQLHANTHNPTGHTAYIEALEIKQSHVTLVLTRNLWAKQLHETALTAFPNWFTTPLGQPVGYTDYYKEHDTSNQPDNRDNTDDLPDSFDHHKTSLLTTKILYGDSNIGPTYRPHMTLGRVGSDSERLTPNMVNLFNTTLLGRPVTFDSVLLEQKVVDITDSGLGADCWRTVDCFMLSDIWASVL